VAASGTLSLKCGIFLRCRFGGMKKTSARGTFSCCQGRLRAKKWPFGAVGTPTWFGFGSLGLAESQLLEIGLKAALMHAVAALVIPVIGLRFVVDWREIRRNLLFVELAILGTERPWAIWSPSTTSLRYARS